MTQRRLLRAWALLSALTAISTAAHFSPLPAPLTGTFILICAAVKARLILLDYLELRGVAGWQAGLVAALVALITLLAILFLAG